MTFFATTITGAPPKVLVTLKPLHSLVAGVMQGVSEPELLLTGHEDPHHFTLTPSQSRKIRQADLIIWMGPALEHFMVKPLQVYAPPHLGLLSSSGLALRFYGKAGKKASCCHHDSHSAHPGPEAHKKCDFETTVDPHVWLDIDNTIVMVRAITDFLVRHDPDNTKTYQRNSIAYLKKLAVMRDRFDILGPLLKGCNFLAFHDAYGYLEKRYGMTNKVTEFITQSGQISLKGIAHLRALVRSHQVNCIFIEPQHVPEIARKLAEELNLSLLMLDPLGLEIKSGHDHYFAMMDKIMIQLQNCQKNHGR